jgi:hypothetical protein
MPRLPATHCPAGHAYTPENCLFDGTHKRCRTCKSALNRRYRLDKGQAPTAVDRFKCGHARTLANTRLTNKQPRCRACYKPQAIEATPPRERRLRRMLAAAVAAKPYLYPTSQPANHGKAY